jgi:hypothetical protein
MAHYAAALSYYQSTLEMRKVTVGLVHPDYSITLNALGTLRMNMGDIDGEYVYIYRLYRL